MKLMNWPEGFDTNDKKRWRAKARRYLYKHEIITGFNGLWGTDEARDMIEDLAIQFARVWNLPSIE